MRTHHLKQDTENAHSATLGSSGRRATCYAWPPALGADERRDRLEWCLSRL